MAGDGDVRAARLDIDDPAEVAALAARIERLDVLVNNAQKRVTSSRGSVASVTSSSAG